MKITSMMVRLLIYAEVSQKLYRTSWAASLWTIPETLNCIKITCWEMQAFTLLYKWVLHKCTSVRVHAPHDHSTKRRHRQTQLHVHSQTARRCWESPNLSTICHKCIDFGSQCLYMHFGSQQNACSTSSSNSKCITAEHVDATKTISAFSKWAQKHKEKL